ncbi:hypothetical protein HD806DRAFT_488344 [Xylariaceae sp. AK1471]|nr:hypothetical protein HD806DRAFT_488344 [Xylariaceae sp. AK1471]
MADPPAVPARKKVKTGCRTCKVRRVKCDEGRPACRRCVSTGRICDGYGIWGGGENEYAGRTAAVTPRPKPTPILLSRISSQFSKMSSQQLSYFSWFRYRTYAKLPLPFTGPFWHTLILQACTVEPAILHATLALGSAHQKESLDTGSPKDFCTALDSQQEFMLQEYTQAIRSLQPHFLRNQDMRSAHVALATCALFTFLENLLGRYTAANAHLHSGLRLLAEVYSPASDLDTELITTKPRGYVDDWIIEVFSRLHVQAALFGQGITGIYPKLPKFPTEPIPTAFQSINQASNHMDRLALGILHLAEQCSLTCDSAANSTHCPGFHSNQERLREELKLWLAAYNATPLDDREAFSPMDVFYLRTPRAYHTMFTIVINTLIWPASEMIYDLYIADFICLIEQLIKLWKAHVARPVWHLNLGMPGFPPKMAHSVGDKAWIPLLYFIAVKCRVHRIRLQAIKLLAMTLHKEGIWDAKLTIIVAKEVMRIEEGDYYQDFKKDDDFDTDDMPTEWDISLPPLPEYRRLSNLQVGLPEPLGVLTLEYDQARDKGGLLERRKRWYDLRAQRWSGNTSDPS